MQATNRQQARSLNWLFLAWLGLFYACWLSWVAVGRHWPLLREHWGIAAAMVAGSYFAGSTPLGGGTVGFPVLVLLFDGPATLGRDFSFAIQSAGMVSASIFIFCRKRRLAWETLKWALLGSAAGTPLGILFVAPHVAELFIKLLFAVTWASFGLLHLCKIRQIAGYQGITPVDQRLDRWIGLLIGLVGGATVAAITGVGMEMLLYAALVLLRQADLKIAIPSAVVLMAFTSVVGLVTKLSSTGLQAQVFGNWLAAAPVVVVGAPVGAWVVDRLGRQSTLIVVSVLCVLQLAWTVSKEWHRLGPTGLVATLAAVAALCAGFAWLYRIGTGLARPGGRGSVIGDR